MIDDELSELPPSALRDYADDPRIERVWQRLEPELGRPVLPARAGFFLLPAAAALVFSLGVVVGRQSSPSAVSSPSVAAEGARAGQPIQQAAPAHGERPVTATGRAPTVPPRATPARAAASGVATLADDVPVIAQPEASPYVVPPTEPPAWQRQADLGDFSAARATLERAGGFGSAISTASPDQLMTLVDVARSTGEREHAVRALRRLLDSFAGAPEAPLAAWTLGNLLEQGGDRLGSANAYALYRRLSPTGDFAEDAAAREVDVALSEGNHELATQLVEQYQRDFPNGHRLAELREDLKKFSQERSDAGSSTVENEPPVKEALPSAEPSPYE